MKFRLIKRTQKEIDQIIEERRFYAKRVKGLPDCEVCPLVVVLGNGEQIDVWSLTEQQILDLVKVAAKEMTPDGPSDKVGLSNAFKVVACWREKHQIISADFVADYFKLKNRFRGAQKEVVKDMLIPVVNETVDSAREIAKFIKGREDDFSAVTDTDILAVIMERERQVEARKSANKNTTA